MNVLIDSHGWIEYFAEGKLASKYAKYVEAANISEYVTPSIVIYEVYKRIKFIRSEDAALKAIAHIIGQTSIISVDKKVAIDAAEISINKKLGMADAMIKAIAEDKNAKLITGDVHFKGMQDIIFID